jgi:hypothetical protein
MLFLARRDHRALSLVYPRFTHLAPHPTTPQRGGLFVDDVDHKLETCRARVSFWCGVCSAIYLSLIISMASRFSLLSSRLCRALRSPRSAFENDILYILYILCVSGLVGLLVGVVCCVLCVVYS